MQPACQQLVNNRGEPSTLDPPLRVVDSDNAREGTLVCVHTRAPHSILLLDWVGSTRLGSTTSPSGLVAHISLHLGNVGFRESSPRFELSICRYISSEGTQQSVARHGRGWEVRQNKPESTFSRRHTFFDRFLRRWECVGNRLPHSIQPQD